MKYNEIKKCLLNPYYLILISILISPLLIINSSYKIKQRETAKINDNKENLNLDEIHLRHLDFISDSKQICERSSNDLMNYFNTGDTKFVKLFEYQEEKEPSETVITLIYLFSNEGDFDENRKNYFDHLSPMIVFVVMAFLCFPLWIIFCACSCCNCKCIRKCQEPKCKIPFFIILIIINLIFIVNCCMGIIKIKPIFEGLANAECSILRFINEIFDGEIKEILPKWGGISEILQILSRTADKIEEMSRDNSETLTKNKRDAYNTAKTTFLNALQGACDNIIGEANYEYETDYFLDIANDFGKCQNNDVFTCTSGSYAEKWISEAEITNDVDLYYNIIGEIIRTQVSEAMREAKDIIQDIGDSIQVLKDNIGKEIIKISDKIDEIGKLILRLFFIILLIISLLQEIFFIFLFIFSCGKCNCDCLESFMKTLINIFWNILSLITILTFLIGGIIIVIAEIGNDTFDAFSYLISERNLLSPSPKIFGDSSIYLDICFNGDGDMADELGLENDLHKIGNLLKLTKILDKLIVNITEKKEMVNTDYVYDEVISELNKRYNDQIDFGFINPNTNEHLNLYESITKLNEKLETYNINDTWSFSCSSEFPNYQPDTCSSVINTSKCMNPKDCKNSIDERYDFTLYEEANKYAALIEKIYSSINYAQSINTNSLKNKAGEIKTKYRAFINDAQTALDQYTDRFKLFNNIFESVIGGESILGFINCAFIGRNIKIVLNYLKETLGKDFFTLGIVFVVNGVIILCHITFTILLLSTMNEVNRIKEIDKLKGYVNSNDNQGMIQSGPTVYNNQNIN